jgi:hypothetical protein
MEHIDVCEVTVRDELLSALHLFSAAFDADYTAGGTDAVGEKTETTLWATADLDHSPSFPHTNLVKQPG